MKPIKLHMQAFGPYVEPVTLNFARDLGDEKIFLIHGDTGAGKTTILDAICYALYGETSGKARDGKSMRSLSAADDVATEVEFEFKLGEKTFTAWRKITYNPNRQEKFQSKQEFSFDNDGEKISLTKEREIKTKVIELLGFNAEQFRQVVMLPQGKFAEFLSAEADKRQEVLNVLFDSTPYAEIEKALAERAKTSAAEVKTLDDRRQDKEKQLADANAENLSIPELTAKLSELQGKVNALKKLFDDAQEKLTNGKILDGKFKNLRELTATVVEAKKFLDEADEKLKVAQAEHKRREDETERRKELERTVDELKKISKMLADLKKRESALSTAQQNLQTATKDFAICDAKKKSYEERLNLRKSERAKLAGADAKFVDAKNILTKAKQLEQLLRDIDRLEKNLVTESEKLSSVAEKFKSAQIELNRLQIVHSAAHLATTLVDGEPCPVCGSREHPKIIDEAIPSAAEIKAAQKTVDNLTKENSVQERTVAGIERELATQRKRLPEFDGVPDVLTAQKNFDEAKERADKLKTCQDNIDTGEKLIEQNQAALTKATENRDAAKIAVAKLQSANDEAKRNIPAIYLDDDKKLVADLNAAQNEFNTLDKAWDDAQKFFNAATNDYSARKATFQTEKKNFDALDAELKGKTQPNVDELERTAKTSAENYDAARDERAELENTLRTAKNLAAELDDINQKLAAAQKTADMWRRLSDVANATGKGEAELKISFQRYFLSTMFDDVIAEANNRLFKMSDCRYTFRMKDEGKTKAKSAGLNLEILDEYTGKHRGVETLSGGESFLASLSLALGLASVVSNKVGGIKLDTIFIDEGFGSLDNDALNFAISTITEKSGGRLVGIISHVEALKDNLPVRLEVTKKKIGSTARFVSR